MPVLVVVAVVVAVALAVFIIVYPRVSLDNNFAYDTTISSIGRCRVFALETVIVAEGHVLLGRQHLILFHVLHVVGVRQPAYVVIW